MRAILPGAVGALFAAIMLYAAPLGGHAARVYDCHHHARTTTCRVHVSGAPSSDYGMTVNGLVVPVSIDFGVRVRKVAGHWRVVGGPLAGTPLRRKHRLRR